MPYLDPYIDADTPEEYEKIIKKLHDRQRELYLRLQEADNNLAFYQVSVTVGSVIIFVFMFLMRGN